MSLHNPPALYTGGKTNLSTDRFTNVVLKAQYQKQALDEASKQYFTKLGSSINTAGVRHQDLDDGQGNGILKELNDWKANGIANKDAIAKGGMPYQKHMAKYQDIMAKIDQSKLTAKQQLEIGKGIFEGKFSPREDDMPVLASMEKSIYSKDHYKQDGVTPYSIGDTSGAVPPLDELKFQKGVIGQSALVADENTARVDNKTGLVYITKSFKPESIAASAQAAGERAVTDKAVKFKFQDLLKVPSFVKDATEAYQKFYKTDDIVDNEQKAAKANQIMLMEGAKAEKEVKDPNYAQALKLQLIAKREAAAKDLAAYKQKIKPIKDDPTVGYLSDEVAKEVGQNLVIKQTGKTKDAPEIHKRVVFTDQVDPQRLRIINGKDKDGLGGVEPDLIKTSDTPGAPTREGYYVMDNGDWVGAGGQIISKEAVKDRYIKEAAPSKFKAETGTKAKESTPTEKPATTSAKASKWSKYQIHK